MPVVIKEYAPSSAKLKMLIYGKSGTGKTTFGATAPKVLFVSSEAGLLSVADKKVQYAQINNLQDLRDVYLHLQKGGHDFETVVLDSLTDMQNHIIMQITGGKRMPQKGEWSDFGFEMNKVLRMFRDLPMHVIFLALEKDIEGEESETSMLMPDLYGSVRDKVGGYMDYVGRIGMWSVTDSNGTKHQKRGISFLYNQRFLAKARRGKFEDITEPDFNVILSVATIEVGEEKVITEVASEHVVPIFPREAGDRLRTKEQAEDIMSLWDTYMAFLNTPEENRKPMREKLLMKYCGVKFHEGLLFKQAAAFIDVLRKQVDIERKKEQERLKETAPDSATATSPEEAQAHSEREAQDGGVDVVTPPAPEPDKNVEVAQEKKPDHPQTASPEVQEAAKLAFGDENGNRTSLQDMTKEELEGLADHWKISGWEAMNRDQLINAILDDAERQNAEKKEEEQYDVMAELARRQELDTIAIVPLRKLAKEKGIDSYKMIKSEIIDALIKLEFPNSPSAAH